MPLREPANGSPPCLLISSPDFRMLQFSSHDYPSAARLAAWQDVLTRKLINARVTATGLAFHADVQLRAQANFRIAGGTISASHNRLLPARPMKIPPTSRS